MTSDIKFKKTQMTYINIHRLKERHVNVTLLKIFNEK